MPNIQVIDGADNCAYDIFEADIGRLRLIFPGKEQDGEFADELVARVGEARASDVLNEIWKRPLDKKLANGIHGTLFFWRRRRSSIPPRKNLT